MVKEKINTKHYKALLETKLAELRASLGRGTEDISIEYVSDELDNIVSRGNREMALAERDRMATTLRRVMAALQRIQYGNYAECVHCETSISAKRLNAIPWAERCVSCEDLHEKALKEQITWGLEDHA